MKISSPAVLRLELNYLPPSQNVLKRMHWTKQYKEKQKAFDALQSALHFIGFDYSIGTTTQEARRICLTAYDTLRSYRATQKQRSISKSNKSKWPAALNKKP